MADQPAADQPAADQSAARQSAARQSAAERSAADREPDSPLVDGIVLAAGRSTRMGRPKPLLWIDGETFVEHAVRTLRAGGCRDVVVVVSTETHRVPALADAAGGRYVVNDEPQSEQIESLRIGLDALGPEADAAAVLPVDQPLVAAETVAALVAAFGDDDAPIVRPVHAGEPGHPTIIARRLFRQFFSAALPRGAETVIRQHADRARDVPVGDTGVVTDINTPEEYRRHVEDA